MQKPFPWMQTPPGYGQQVGGTQVVRKRVCRPHGTKALHKAYWLPCCFCVGPCGKLLYTQEDDARTLASPGFHNIGYPNNMNCQYEIQAPSRYQIRVRFVVRQSEMFLDQSVIRISNGSEQCFEGIEKLTILYASQQH